MKAEDKEILREFNEKATRIIGSSYVKRVRENGISLNISMNDGILDYPEVSIPAEDLIESLILTLRFFVQDNEKISIRNLSKIYKDMNNEYSEDFSKIRVDIKKYLNKKSNMKESNRHYSMGEILELFIYGYYAHYTKKQEYQNLKKDSFNYKIYLYNFHEVLLKYIESISKIVSLNNEVIVAYK